MIRPRKQPDICQGTCSLTFRQYSTEDTDFSSVISIHAPAEGATKRGFAEWQNNVYFNPRSRGGSDGRLRHSSRKLKNFNPRSRGGSDRCVMCGEIIPEDFNPHSRGGSDDADKHAAVVERISIHAPAEGATRTRQAFRWSSGYFNPRSRGGSDKIPIHLKMESTRYFNPRSRGGSDQFFHMGFYRIIISIHAPAEGATPAG